MAEALKAAKDAFGSDAVILGVKTSKPAGRFMGKWKKKKVALTAATDTPYPDHDQVSLSNKRTVSPKPARPISYSGKNETPWVKPSDNGGSIRTFSRSTDRSPARDMLPASYVKKLFWMQQQMCMAGVANESVQELVLLVHKVAVKRTHVSEEVLMDILEETLQDRIRLKPDPDSHQSLPKCMVFVGPTGVGKTTTIAKIATIYSHHRKSSIGLITLDDQRIGGISQLAIYARILGVPMKVASSAITLSKALEALADKQLILIDTAGVNPNDLQQLNQLEDLVTEIQRPHIHLVLSTTTRTRDMKVIANAFQQLPIRNLIFTKVDESTTQGNILSGTLQTSIPLSYYADGRNVPDDIHVMTARRLMRMIFNESSLRQVKSAPPEILAGRLQSFEKYLEKHPWKAKPYRTFSTQWAQGGQNTGSSGYAKMAKLNGGR